MLFCPSFTQSERFLQTDQLIIRLSCSRDKLHSHVDEKRVRERVQVRCTDLVGSDLLQGEGGEPGGKGCTRSRAPI